MAALGDTHKLEWESLLEGYAKQISTDSTNSEALLAYAETQVILYIFGFLSRDETIPKAKEVFGSVLKLDSVSSGSYKIRGILNFLDWKWSESREAFEKSISIDPENLNARHWYSLWLSAMGDFDGAIAQSDTIYTMDPKQDYRIGRGSLYYFARRNEELRDLMIEEVESDPTAAWGYDWLGMAYCELKDYEESIETYYKAFDLSNGLAEVGGGLGHALGLGGNKSEGKKLADFYSKTAASGRYVPSVQRAFIHIGLGEYDEALALLEQAYDENSWFLIFIQVEPWMDPIRSDPRFKDIMARMNFPDIQSS